MKGQQPTQQPLPDTTSATHTGALPGQEEIHYHASRRVEGLETLRARYLRHSFSRHAHDGYALGVIVHGALAFRYLGRDHVAPCGSLNLVIPGEVHDGHGADHRGWAYRMFYLAPTILQRAAEEAGCRGDRLPVFNAGVLQNRPLADELLTLHADMENEAGAMPSLEQEGRLLRLLVGWIRGHGDTAAHLSRAGIEPRAVRMARAFLDEHFAQDVRLDALALHTGLSPFHLSRVFQRATGLPPHAYLTQRRVAEARSLIGGGEPLADVALACGFSDQSHMTRQFKRQLGFSPGAYRKIIQDR